MSSIIRIIDKFYNSKIGKAIANPAATAATAATIATVSNVSKDAVNCAYYTTQSLNNKKIPEDQRPFVAGLDLSNGILNVLLQIGMSFGISGAIMSIFDNHISKAKAFATDANTAKAKYAALEEKLKQTISESDFIERYAKHIDGRKAVARLGFTVVAVNVAMQILTKRIITPLIATPMASYFKDKFTPKTKDEKQEVQNKHEIACA